MKIIYLISMILLIIEGILIKKSQKKLNILIVAPIVLLAYMAYVSIVANILHFMRININSISVGIINIVVSIMLGITIIKQKEIQKYYVCKKDLVALAILFILAGYVIYKFFGCFDKVKYMSDGMIHYTAAKQFSINEKLFKDASSKTIFINPLHMPLAYINEGLLMNSLVDYIGQVGTLRLFLMVDAFMWVMCGYAFFYLLRYKIDGKIQWIIGLLLTLIYCFGYPLNSLTYGFHYLNYAIVFISFVIILINETEKEGQVFFIISLSLLNIGIMFTYYLFVPIIYGAIFIYYIQKFKVSKKMIIYTLVTLVIPGVIGLQYYFLDKGMTSILSKGINSEGSIIRNTYTGLILYVPFMLYYMYNQVKSKDKQILFYMLVLTFIQTLGIYIIYKNGRISTYYFYKMYYIMQLFIISSAYFGMIKMMEQEKFIKYLCLYFTIFIGLSAVFSSTGNIIVKDAAWGIGKDRISDFVEVYKENKWAVFKRRSIITKEEFKNLKYIEKNISKEFDKTIVISPNLGFYLVFDYKTEKDCIEKWNNNQIYKYFINFCDTKHDSMNLDNTEVMYKKGEITIYKKNYIENTE